MSDQTEESAIQEAFRPMFYPKSIAVVGASTRPEKTGNYVLRSVLASGVDKIYPVHAGGAREILGKRAYHTIEAIPEDVELFLFAIPQHQILPTFRAAIAKGCRAAVIFTAGFKESGEEGEKQEIALRNMANEAGVKIIGPNTMGFFRSDSRINATFSPVFANFFTERRGVAVISQSGGVSALIINQLFENYLPVSTLVGLGNRANVEFADLLEYFTDDFCTASVALFIEGIEDIRRFSQIASRCARKKPVLVLGVGYTEAGKKVAKSHTGSMATSGEIYKAAFQQAGLLQVKSVQEMVDALKIINYCPPLQGNTVAIMTHTAGPSIIATDILENGGFKLASLSEKTKNELLKRNVLPDFMPIENPVDMTTFGYMEPRRYLDTLEPLVEDENVDSVLSIYMSTLEGENAPTFPVAEFSKVAHQANKPVVVVWGAPVGFEAEFKPWVKARIPVYPTPERAATALVNLARYAQLRGKEKRQPEPVNFSSEVNNLIQKALAARQTVLLEPEAKKLLEMTGIRVARTYLATNEDEAVKLANQIGYPVGLKIVSEIIIHKSDVGGVRLNVKEENEVRTAYREIKQKALAEVAGGHLQGVAVQRMLPAGTEVIVGAMRDEQAGPVVMFGLGGIWVEALNDVVFRLAPVGPEDAEEMLREIKGYPILQGFRGTRAVNREALRDLIVTVGHLISQFPVREIDLNPVIFYNSEYAVADARIIL